ncbi:hypothetical protein FH608_029490 [Nonomuraea phyllanthi]|uniref:Uncharacterized protein n=1 Tax=Nonomuraea phyllanthi TaxID=2219224 RepID=A0A5C4W218_9ACTN|nr:hypothetical protein [Nonomuraea phyllanthi]KAB8191401.1 hypothetical protein FH608_029490 [Nonomuraea phyllanthi]
MSVVLLSILSMLWPPPDPPVSERWHAWPVSRVFPQFVHGASPSGARITYVLAGVAPEAPCRTAFQPAAVRRGCRVALRATYADSTQTFVATVGVAVLDPPEPEAPERETPVIDTPGSGVPGSGTSRSGTSGSRRSARASYRTGRPPTVRPVAFPGGPAERFGRRQYVTGVVIEGQDHYLVATAAGYADGRPYRRGDRAMPRLRATARQLAAALHRALTR